MPHFATPAAITAVIDIPAGRVQLVAAERTDTVVDIQPADPAKSRDVKAAEETTVEYAEGVLRIDSSAKNQIFGPSGSIEVTVQLPAGSHVRARAASAGFRAVGRLGDVVFDGAHGEIKLDEAATARLTISAGDVTVGRLTGSAQISAQKGDITITEAVRGELVLTTQAGSITVVAAPGVSASLDAATAYGRISNGLKNDGTSELAVRATTSYGDITARSL
ncbi:DUF4097 family beta strand repeat-containing protein [Actinoplanes sp. CA-030573]|uniref:DUF4097 family beta strand repeat-containing protein n=1 Tax=Actinoplanes sp. CA-030573 TaxID=3239898 RepID=UPI003D914BF2